MGFNPFRQQRRRSTDYVMVAAAFAVVAVLLIWAAFPEMRVAVASDHAGYRLKAVVIAHLAEGGHEVLDMGTDSEESVDYPPFCAAAARAVVDSLADFGIVIGGSGQGEQIAANKVNGARAALCHDEWMARMARGHNNANVLAFGARVLADARALDIVDLFLGTEFEGGRHQPRIEQLAAIEAQECGKNRAGGV